MRFAWTEEQRLLMSSINRYIQSNYGFDLRRKRVEQGFSRDVWKGFAELGILGLPFAEEFGGFAGSPLDILAVMEAFGRALVVEPYISAIVLSGELLQHNGSEDQRSELIPGIISGDIMMAFAHTEANARFNLSRVETRAVREGSDYVLSGQKIAVLGAPDADWLIISARTSGDSQDKTGISLFLVPAAGEGLGRVDYTTVDGFSAANLNIDKVSVPQSNLLGPLDQALPAIERATDKALSAVCGEALGGIAALNEKSLEYGKTRSAFGQEIAKFQVLGHRLVDMQISYEQASALALKSALQLEADNVDAIRTTAACKVKVSQEYLAVARQAVQLHGAVGISDELEIGHYLKRALVISTLYGDANHHLDRYIELNQAIEKQDKQ